MAKEKSLVEEAIIQMKNLEETVAENAKGILASTMKEEIKELVKESLSEQEEMELDIDVDSEDEESEDDEEMLDMDSEDEGEEMLMMDLPGDELEVDDEEEVLLPLDLTGASDEEILKVFKAMGEEDGIIVTQDEDGISLKDDEAGVEYEIHTESEDEAEEDEVVYEIEISEEDDDMEEVEDETEMEIDEEWKEEVEEEWGSKKHEFKREKGHKTGDEDGHYKDYEGKFGGNKGDKSKTHKGLDYEGEMEEAAHTLGNGSRNDAKKKSLPKMKVKTNESELKSEVESLRAKNEEYRKALNIFREKLNEVAVFNSNLAYATRLFTEHTTTKQEKINILRRFDSVETLKESKTLYKNLKEEFESKESTSINESVESKVSKTPSRGASTNLIESKTYENPQFLRMKDLMNKLK